jgi:hypothetical protein
VSRVVVVPPGEGEVVPRRFGERTVVKAAEAETRGAWVSGWIQEEAADPDERQRAAVYLRYGLEIVGPPPAP